LPSLENGKVTTFEIKPEDVGLKVAKPEDLRGADADTNAKALREVMKGKKGAFRDVACSTPRPRSWLAARRRT